MSALIPVQKTGMVVSTSRTLQEMLQVEQGNQNYSVLTTFLNDNIACVDRLAEELGQLTSQLAVKKLTDRQYKQGNAMKQFIRKNLYISPQEREKNERERRIAGMVTSLAAETAVKVSARGALALLAEHERFSVYRQSYMLLASFANNGGGDLDHANIELSKIRNALPLSLAKRKKLQNMTDTVPSDLNELFSSLNALFGENSGQIRESLTYMLFSISCQKYGLNETGWRRLLEFYRCLGYSENYARELLREHTETYQKITDTQNAYLKMARGMMCHLFIDMPQINVDNLMNRANEMARYDPYSFRRQTVRKVAPAGGKALIGVFTHHPELVIQAGATALSQFKLENKQNVTNYLYDAFIKKGLPGHAVDLIAKQSDEIRKIVQNDG